LGSGASGGLEGRDGGDLGGLSADGVGHGGQIRGATGGGNAIGGDG